MSFGTKGKGISANVLKWLACITMFIDHAAVAIFERGVNAGVSWMPNSHAINLAYFIMRMIGRMAFPIFCMLLVEGFQHTLSRQKYFLRLVVLALVSELPYDFALRYSYWNPVGGDGFWNHVLGLMFYNNVVITLVIGFAAIWAMDALKTRFAAKEADKKFGFWWSLLRITLFVLIFVLAMAFAAFLMCDYGIAGVIVIIAFYLLRDYHKMVAYAFAVVILALLWQEIELCGLIALIPIYFYKGERGNQNKYVFYAFYPVHLAVLALVALAMGLPIFF